jgi:hypothetical protein
MQIHFISDHKADLTFKFHRNSVTLMLHRTWNFIQKIPMAITATDYLSLKNGTKISPQG